VCEGLHQLTLDVSVSEYAFVCMCFFCFRFVLFCCFLLLLLFLLLLVVCVCVRAAFFPLSPRYSKVLCLFPAGLRLICESARVQDEDEKAVKKLWFCCFRSFPLCWHERRFFNL